MAFGTDGRSHWCDYNQVIFFAGPSALAFCVESRGVRGDGAGACPGGQEAAPRARRPGGQVQGLPLLSRRAPPGELAGREQALRPVPIVESLEGDGESYFWAWARDVARREPTGAPVPVPPADVRAVGVSPRASKSTRAGMVWYGMVWYGMVLNYLSAVSEGIVL